MFADRFEPRCDTWERRVRDSFAKQSLLREFAAGVQRLEPGCVILEMPFDARFTQQHGFLHAGVTTAVMDTACGYAAYSLMDEKSEVLTVEFKTNLLAPAEGQTFEFIGQVRKPGRTLSVCEGEAYAINEGDRKLYATMSATMMAVQEH